MNLKFLFVAAVFLGSFLFSHSIAQAQIYTGVTVEWTANNKVKSYAETIILDYQTRLYYKAGVDSLLYDQAGTEQYGDEVNPASAAITNEIPAIPGFQYISHSLHYVRPYSIGGPGAADETYHDALGYAAAKGKKPPSPKIDLTLFQQGGGVSILNNPASKSNITEGNGSPNSIEYDDILIYQYLILITLELRDPHIDGIAPSGAPLGREGEIPVRFAGQFLLPHYGTGVVPTINVSGNGVTARPRTGYLDETGLDAYFTVAANADVGDHNVTITVRDPAFNPPLAKTSNTVTFRVGDRTPVITGISTQQGNAGEILGVTITGQGFGLNPQIQIVGGGINTTVQTQSPTQINVTFAIGDSAPAGERGVKVKSLGVSGSGFLPAPGNSDTSNAVQFNVLAAADVDLPNIGSIENKSVREASVTVSNAPNGTYQTRLTIENPSDAKDGRAIFEGGANEIVLNGNETKTIRIKGDVGSKDNNNIKLVAIHGPQNKRKDKSFAVSWVEFLKKDDCAGFDDRETTIPNPSATATNYLFVRQNLSNQAKARIRPGGAAGNFRLDGVANQFTVTPATITSTNEVDITVTATVAGAGNQELKAVSSQAGITEAASKLPIIIRARKNFNVIVHTVTEDNDDVQDTPEGQGSPNRVAFIILPGPNGVSDSVAGGDDIVGSGGPFAFPAEYRQQYRRLRRTLTGPNGIVETTVGGDDIIYVPPTGVTGSYTYQPDEAYSPFNPIPINNGVPFGTCVSSGVNNKLDTLPDSGDQESTDSLGNPVINSGANGICQTEANDNDIAPSSPPNLAALQTYLNETTWGRQANIHFTVDPVARPASINFDLNRDQKYDYPTISTAESDAMSNTLQVAGSINLYYLGTLFSQPTPADTYIAVGIYQPSNPTSGRGYFGPAGLSRATAAHELGHLVARGGHSQHDIDLMFDAYLPAINQCRITKLDWDLVQP